MGAAGLHYSFEEWVQIRESEDVDLEPWSFPKSPGKAKPFLLVVRSWRSLAKVEFPLTTTDAGLVGEWNCGRCRAYCRQTDHCPAWLTKLRMDIDIPLDRRQEFASDMSKKNHADFGWNEAKYNATEMSEEIEVSEMLMKVSKSEHVPSVSKHWKHALKTAVHGKIKRAISSRKQNSFQALSNMRMIAWKHMDMHTYICIYITTSRVQSFVRSKLLPTETNMYEGARGTEQMAKGLLVPIPHC